MKRRHIGWKTKYAAALLQMKRVVLTDDGGFRFEYIIGHEQAKTMTADQIIKRFRVDHYPIPHAEGGPDEPWNLQPMPIADHDKKTATIDVPGIAKRKRVAKGHIEHTRTMQTPRDERPAKQSKWAKRPFPKRSKR